MLFAQEYLNSDAKMNVFERTVKSCLHLVRGISPDYLNPAFGSGVLIRYKGRFFICSVEHFTRHTGTSIGILTGKVNDGNAQIYELGDFAYMQHFNFEDNPDTDDFVYVLDNPSSGQYLDIAFREVSFLENLIQEERIFNLNGIGEIKVPKGHKDYMVVDEYYEIDPNERYSFYGRIRPRYENSIINYQEYLYWNLGVKKITSNYIEFDLGDQVRDYDRFRGCSGAPILDSKGRLVALVTHGPSDVNETSIYGYRFDRAKLWIELMYFSNIELEP